MDYKLDPGMSAKPPTPPSFSSHTSHSLYPIHFPSPSPDHQMDPNVLPQPRYPSTCIPSLMPPGVDPTSVDFRTFFPYIPNEVKHRKRTSRHQLKVLEDVFRKDTKPNAVLRKKLAAELEMSPRAVQVRPAPLLPPRTRAHPPRRALSRSGSRTGTFHPLTPAVALTPHIQACQGKSPSQARLLCRRPRQTHFPISEKVSLVPRRFPKRLFKLVNGYGKAYTSYGR